MLSEPNIFYLLLLPDWRPNEVTPFQGFAPGLLDHVATMQRLVDFPGDTLEWTMPQCDRLARRVGGIGGWHWTPFNASSLLDLNIEPTAPLWVLFSPNQVIAKAVEDWRAKLPLRPLHVGTNGTKADCSLADLNADTLAEYCQTTLAAAKQHLPALDISQSAEAIKNWKTPARHPSPLKFASHNVSVPNELVLLSEGAELSTGEAVDGEPDNAKYIEAIEDSARHVLALRASAGEPEAFRANPPRPGIILFAPAIYRGLGKALAPLRKDAPAGFFKAVRLLEHQRTFPFLFTNAADADQPALRGALALRGQELKTQAAAIGLRAASTVAATLRVPPSVNRTAGAVSQLSNYLRHAEHPKPAKAARVFKAVQDALASNFSPQQMELLKAADAGIKIFGDAPLEWLSVDGLPLGIRFDTSRINATPGALTFGELSAPATLHLEPDAFLDFLVVSSFGQKDEIREHMRIALEALAETAGVKFRGRFVEVRTKKDLADALNAFDGPIAVFDMHGSHDGHVGGLWIGDELVDIWEMRGVIKTPPIVALSACDTHPADRSHATVANGFIHCGARTVLATLLPVQSIPAAGLIARLLLRAVQYTKARIKSGRAVPWVKVVGGLLRMQLVSEAVRALVESGALTQGATEGLLLAANEQILRDNPGWFDSFESALRKAVGFDNAAWSGFWPGFLAGSDAIRYVQVGNPESIVVTSAALIESVYDS